MAQALPTFDRYEGSREFAKALTYFGVSREAVVIVLNSRYHTGDFSKNIVCGEAFRKKWKSSKPPIRNIGNAARKVPTLDEAENMLRQFTELVLVQKETAPASGKLPKLEGLSKLPPPEKGRCEEPIDADGVYRRCGKTVQPGRPKCAEHLRAKIWDDLVAKEGKKRRTSVQEALA